MMDLALSLASNPSNYLIAVIAILIAILVHLLTSKVADAKRRSIEFIAGLLIVIGVMIWGAYQVPSPRPSMPDRQLLATDMGPIHVTPPGATVQLLDVESLKGWGEGDRGPIRGGDIMEHGDHRANTDRQRAPEIFDRILRAMGKRGFSGAAVAGMDQARWVTFLTGLDPQERRLIGSIPFATLVLHASDGHERRVILFAHDSMEIRDEAGRRQASVCALRLFNVRERATLEREAIFLGIGDGACPNGHDSGIELQGLAR